MADENLLDRLEERAEHHAREAQRYRIAADVVRQEARRGSASRTTGERRRGEPTDPRRSSMAMVDMILTETGRPWRMDELRQEMQRRGWQTTSKDPLNTARAAAHRLARQGRIRRRSDGQFAPITTESEPVGLTDDEPADDPWAPEEEPPF